MKTKMKLIITRHRETEDNLKGIHQGHLPGKLTKKGKEQARRLAERLRDEKIDVNFSSDLARASDTAEEIAKFHTDVPIYFIEELRERNLGEFVGKKQDIKEIFKMSEGNLAEKRVELSKEFSKRGKDFIKKILANEKNILIVAHGGINSVIIANLLGEKWENIFNNNLQKNTSITIFEFDKDNKPKLKLMNCIKHLK